MPGTSRRTAKWAEYRWTSSYPGLVERYASFAGLVEAERESCEELEADEARVVHPEDAE